MFQGAFYAVNTAGEWGAALSKGMPQIAAPDHIHCSGG
jgi:hypothetical protein